MAETQFRTDVPLAEYATLRQEMDSYAMVQHQIVTAQLAIAGAVFSFSLAIREEWRPS